MHASFNKLIKTLNWAILSLSLMFLAEEFIRVSGYVFHEWGFKKGILDGAIWYKLGEAFVLVPFLVFLLVLNNGETRQRFAAKARWLMFIGAALCLLAWLNLCWRVFWSWWSLALLGIGILLPLWMRQQAAKVSKWRAVLMGGGLLVIFVLNLGISYLTTGYVLAPLPASPPPPANSRDERWRQDLHYLANELPRLHANAYHTISKASFETAVADLDHQIPNLSDAQIITRMMHLVSLIGDAHTSLVPTGFHQYPLRLLWLKDGLFVVETTPEYLQALGAQVTGIGDVDIETAYQQVSGLISHENESKLLEVSKEYLATPEILQALGILPDSDYGHFTFVNANGNSFSLDIKEMASSKQVTSLVPKGNGKKPRQTQWISAVTQTPLYRQKAEQPFWYEILPEAKLLYFKYNVCNPFGFASFNKGLWQAVDENHIERLVVDLRANSGGSSFQFDAFMEELIKRPVLNQRGRLFVLIDRGTYSSAVLNAISLKLNTAAIFLGEGTGGSPNGYGEIRTFHLRNSGLPFSYSTRYIQAMPDTAPELLNPNQFIVPSSRDYFTDHDPVLEAVLSTIK